MNKSTLNYKSNTCPILETQYGGNCALNKCMYNRGGFESHCSFKAVQMIRDGDGSKQEKRSAISEIFQVDEEETEVAIKRVVSVLCLNEYFKYAFGKDVTEAKKKELLSLQNNPGRYTLWKPSSKKVPYEHMVTTIDFLLNEMR